MYQNHNFEIIDLAIILKNMESTVILKLVS